jgi:Right handed beta helix region
VSDSRDFYVSPRGSDTNPGTSPASPWRTISAVNAASLRPGDTVFFEGGARFPEPLAPYAGMVGTSSAPIVFDSYGAGRATLAGGIYLNSVSNLTFHNLDVTADGRGVYSSAQGSGARRITLRDVAISNVPLAGISSNNVADAGWLIDRVTISSTGDSGIYFVGRDFTISRSTIIDTGRDASIPFPRHGIYAVGPDARIVDNTITRFSTSGVSLRSQNGVVAGNWISGGERGVAFEDQTTAPGTTRIVYNAISQVADSGIVVARPAGESFLVANNTIASAGTYGVYIQVVPRLTIANNVVELKAGEAALLSVRAPSVRYREHNNLWFGGAQQAFYFDGSPRTWSGYRTVSGEGRSDRQRQPLLGRNLVPRRGSPVIDAGSTAVDASIVYGPTCDGLPFHYCGAAPDLGASEHLTTSHYGSGQRRR